MFHLIFFLIQPDVLLEFEILIQGSSYQEHSLVAWILIHWVTFSSQWQLVLNLILLFQLLHWWRLLPYWVSFDLWSQLPVQIVEGLWVAALDQYPPGLCRIRVLAYWCCFVWDLVRLLIFRIQVLCRLDRVPWSVSRFWLHRHAWVLHFLFLYWPGHWWHVRRREWLNLLPKWYFGYLPFLLLRWGICLRQLFFLVDCEAQKIIWLLIKWRPPISLGFYSFSFVGQTCLSLYPLVECIW